MNYEAVLYRKEHGVGIITLHRPGHGNAINEQMIKELHGVLNEAEPDGEVRVLIFTGEDRFFCSAVDLKEPRVSGATQRSNRLYFRIERFEKPTIAATNGFAPGGGCELALCCDLRVAAEDRPHRDPGGEGGHHPLGWSDPATHPVNRAGEGQGDDLPRRSHHGPRRFQPGPGQSDGPIGARSGRSQEAGP